MKPTDEMIESATKAYEESATHKFGIEAAITAALARIPGEPAWEINNLKWDSTGKAHSILGTYSIVRIGGENFGLILPGDEENTFPYSHEGHERFCKTCAQQHFNAAISTALSSSPTPHPSLDREGLLEEARATLDKIANAPAWGAPERWETTPAEVRQLARSVVEKIAKGAGK